MCMSMHMYKIMYVSIYRLYIFCMPFLVPRCAKMYIVYIYIYTLYVSVYAQCIYVYYTTTYITLYDLSTHARPT